MWCFGWKFLGTKQTLRRRLADASLTGERELWVFDCEQSTEQKQRIGWRGMVKIRSKVKRSKAKHKWQWRLTGHGQWNDGATALAAASMVLWFPAPRASQPPLLDAFGTSLLLQCIYSLVAESGQGWQGKESWPCSTVLLAGVGSGSPVKSFDFSNK
jgi:hypothetical protein